MRIPKRPDLVVNRIRMSIRIESENCGIGLSLPERTA